MKYLTLLLSVLSLSASAQAEKSHALARYGQPKYPATFKHVDYVNAKAPKGGTLRLAVVGKFTTLNKDAVTQIAADGLLYTFDPLMKRSADEAFTLYACLAEAVDVAPDHSTVTFYINPKAHFNDATRTPVAAEDVQFSYEFLRDHGLPRYRKYFSRIHKFEILNPQVIKLHLSKAEGDTDYDPELPLILANLRVLSKKQIQSIDFENSGLTPIIGAGPYRVASAKLNNEMVYERVPDYWGKDLPINVGENNFDKIVITYYQNAAIHFEGFKAGQFHVFTETNAKRWRTAYNFPAAKDGRVKLVTFQHHLPVTVRMMIFNMRRPVFQDSRVREALTLAFDFEAVNRLAFDNTLLRTESLFANTELAPKGAPSAAELEILKPYGKLPLEVFETAFKAPSTKEEGAKRQNLTKAAKLLAEAGYTSDKPLTISFMYHDKTWEKVVLALRDNLKTIGVILKPLYMDQVPYEEKVIKSDFDMIMHAWSNSRSPGAEQAYYFGAQYAHVPGSSNYIGVTNPDVEALAKKVPHAKNMEELKAYVGALDRAVTWLQYWIPFGYNNQLYIAYWQNHVAYPPLDPNVMPDPSRAWNVAASKI